ncbi:SRPBCC family protein [Methylobacterium nonmethylotrophicum]|uniref:SRPBCC family protein n=1 Tax=Methylobacterium nonmethylotrophicum TaxID=1141884 RepID=A0A4Z0NMN5_9HYPH|nr:SRPBCC family protein [Methylobacterium nonmethylotrophicum]TGD97655.1 SRPBCC family protein [Methylobacterium nonmethylotrophicum]
MTDQHDGRLPEDRSDGPAGARATARAGSWAGRRRGGHDGLGGVSSPGLVGLALAAAAGVAVIGLIGAGTGPASRTGAGPTRRRSAATPEPEITRSITIEDVSADELYRRWRDPDTLRRVMAPFADVEPTGDGQTRWSAGHDLGSWEMRLVDDRPGEVLRWEAQGEGALVREASVRFHPAGGDRGTVVTLRASLDPPGGMLGRVAARMLGGAIPATLAGKSLHFFKALVQTGEIPTTDRQPAARPDPR